MQIEHAYTPPFSPATEPLAVLARLAQNQEDGLQAVGPLGPFEAATFIDLRDEPTRARFPLDLDPLVPGDLAALRKDSSALAEGRFVIACGHGTRSAQALSGLRRRGIEASYLGGGSSWQRALAQVKEPAS